MNSIDLFYQVFKMRYSLEDLSRSFANPYKIGLVGAPENLESLVAWLGETTISAGGSAGQSELQSFAIPQTTEETEQLRSLDLAVVHLGYLMPSEEELQKLALSIPAGTATIYLLQPIGEVELPVNEALPKITCLRLGHEQGDFYKAIFSAFPGWSMRLSRDFAGLREACLNRLVLRSCRDNALVAAASSITVTTPVVGQLLGLLAVSAETLVITAGQLRLALLVGGLFGRPINFFDRVDELWPILGGAWVWRTLARELVGLVPAAGPVAKAAVAWSGTYFVGVASRRFYELGEHLSPAARCRLERLAQEKAAQQVQGLVQACIEGEKVAEETAEAMDEQPTEEQP